MVYFLLLQPLCEVVSISPQVREQGPAARAAWLSLHPEWEGEAQAQIVGPSLCSGHRQRSADAAHRTTHA
ncbi:MAG: hypothetical protein N2508_06245, partial [Anaerolineae bacterium]|nr:hypothetical protein [Anaerolineae bacterium]